MNTSYRIALATAAIVSAASVHARFLQADPVGTKDDLNLYAYVHGDPVNNTDPAGLRCTGEGSDSKCTVDTLDGKKVDRAALKASKDAKDAALLRKIERLEARVTAAYKIAQELGEGTITIKGDEKKNIPDISVSGDRMAEELGRPLDVIQKDVTTPKGGVELGAANPNGRIEVYNAGLNQPSGPRGGYNIVEMALHEAIHFIPQAGVWSGRPDEHQKPFHDALEQILGRPPSY